MIGIILLAITWLLLRLQGRRLSAIGLDHPRRRIAEFAIGFLVLGAAVAVQQLLAVLVTGDGYRHNPGFSAAALAEGARFVANSVAYEELVFRGYLLFQAVRLLGPGRAAWLDALVFGVYHWFSYGVIGNPVAMAYVLLMTGMFGYMLARAFVATRSVAAPIGLHLGWNTAAQLVFSTGPLGGMWLVPASGAAKLQPAGAGALLVSVAWPLASIGMVLWMCRWQERHRPAVDREKGPGGISV